MCIRKSAASSLEDCLPAGLIQPGKGRNRPGRWISCSLPRRSKWLDPGRCRWSMRRGRSFGVTLPGELQAKLQQKNLGLDYRTLDRAVAKGGDIKYIDFRKDWSPHFKRLCIMPDGRLVETGGLQEFAELHGITVAQAKMLIEQGGTLEVNGEVLACQIVNGQPAVARFSAEELYESKGIGLLERDTPDGCVE